LLVSVDGDEPRVVADGEWDGRPDMEAYEVAELMMQTAMSIFREHGQPYFDPVPMSYNYTSRDSFET
jgi:hypothetical protein